MLAKDSRGDGDRWCSVTRPEYHTAFINSRRIQPYHRINFSRGVGTFRGFVDLAESMRIFERKADVTERAGSGFRRKDNKRQIKKGAIILFDFRAAFSSLSHDFLWDVMETIGLPTRYVEAVKLFYVNNRHKLKVGGQLVDGVIVHAGVRQGCPLSPLLFALATDIILRDRGMLARG